MKKTIRSAVVLLSVLAMLPATSFALNPVIQTMYTADPAPMVHKGTLYLFSSHDEDVGAKNSFNMKNWVLATTTDMVNWTQHGVVASLRDFPWASKENSGWEGFDNGAWAPQVIERDGKWYMYAPVHGRGIGVLVADNPLGPYIDPIKKPLIAGHAGGLHDSIDPTVYIDDKGQAYLAWGNPNLWSVKLNKDMISYDTSVGEQGIIRHPMTVKALGERNPPDSRGTTLPKPALRGTSYEEGPWLYKRKNLHYLFFAGGPIPEHLAYSTGPTPEGPWTYGGVVMAPQSAFTNHPGVVDFKGKTYLFYHTAALPGGDGFKRSVAVDELTFNQDGSVQPVQPTKEGPAPAATLDPYRRVEAETIAWSSGVKIEPSSAGGQNVRDIHDGDHIRVRNVDFGAAGARAFTASLSSTAKAGTASGAAIEIRLDKLDGQLIGTLPVSGTGGEWARQSVPVSGAAGVHDIVFVFRGAAGDALFKFDYWRFLQRDPMASRVPPAAPLKPAHNPIIWADVPDIAIIRVGKTYYMSSTTMHMSPGLPIMKSADLVNWSMASYAYGTLEDSEAFRLENGKDAYGAGSWASSIRYHDGVFHASTFTPTAGGRTHVFTTRDPERGPWKETSFEPLMNDHSLFFDDDGRVYMVWGCNKIMLTELERDLTGVKPGGVNKPIIEQVNALFGADQGGLCGEGSQLSKVDGRYYLFNIASPKTRWARSVIVHRADAIDGPYEGRIVLDDRGIAQGGLVDTPEGKWYAYLFKDNGAVGRIPYLVPVTWQDGWPVLGQDGEVPMLLDIPAGGQGASGASGIVASDEFDRPSGAPALPLAWQWNHNPEPRDWSLTRRPGYMSFVTSRIDASLPEARNTLTQRMFGPDSFATTSIDVSRMKDGDWAGLSAFQKQYGFVGVTVRGGARSLVMASADAGQPEEIASIPLAGNTVHLKVDAQFQSAPDDARFGLDEGGAKIYGIPGAPELARFSYSLDGKSWLPIGRPSRLAYTFPHFMGYRYALFFYSTRTPGGRVDFDYYRTGRSGGSP
ncbi:family 43 glycosylhydrolase [Pseudoduganella sp. SL102]|uniref:family 43 glycosylhydrolase n=1 Tax=Pseudoduganella sp. SL102 TaxID=2995154 RepID=UPI00248B5D18|nr:family 43 glycosylhydrolase [Pseudoduganella sp. SL102]WBS00020.1 family 43 glycosylhydrolase [Pseudoduganella sp. SL102]